MAARLASLLLWAAVLTQAVVTGRTDGRIVAGEGAHARRLLGGVAAGVAPAQAPAARLRGSTQGSPLASRFASVSAGGSRPETQFAEPYGSENFDIESGSVESTPGCVNLEKEYQDKCMSQSKLDQACLEATSKYYAECAGANKPK